MKKIINITLSLLLISSLANICTGTQTESHADVTLKETTEQLFAKENREIDSQEEAKDEENYETANAKKKTNLVVGAISFAVGFAISFIYIILG